MTAPCGPQNRTDGFTLLEALIATALMATILAALATITAQWLPNWNRGLSRLARSEHLALGLERLISDVAAAEYVPISRDTLPPLFDGTDRSITFVRTAFAPNAAPSLEIVRIGEMQGDGGPALVRTRTPFMPAVEASGRRVPLNFADPVVLVRGPYRLSFSYAGSDRTWRTSWRGEIRLPRAIKVTLADLAASRIAATSTATVIHAEVPAQCIHSKSLAECVASSRAPDQSAEGDKPGNTDHGRAQ